MLHVKQLHKVEELNAASGRMIAENIPAKNIKEARQHIYLIHQLEKQTQQTYIKEANDIRGKREIQKAAALYWEIALKDYENANKNKMCKYMLKCGTPLIQRAQTWVIIIGNPQKITRDAFKEAQDKALTKIKQEIKEMQDKRKENSNSPIHSPNNNNNNNNNNVISSSSVSLSSNPEVGNASILVERKMKFINQIIEDLPCELPECLAECNPIRRHSEHWWSRNLLFFSSNSSSSSDNNNNNNKVSSSRKGSISISQEREPNEKSLSNMVDDDNNNNNISIPENEYNEDIINIKPPPLPLLEEESSYSKIFGVNEVSNSIDINTNNNNNNEPSAIFSETQSFSDVSSVILKNEYISSEVNSASSPCASPISSTTYVNEIESELTNYLISSLLEEEVLQQIDLLLRTYVEFKPEIGYIQGMPYIAAMIILVIKDPCQSFMSFANLIEYGHLLSFMKLRREGVTYHFTVFDTILLKSQPTLYALFKKYNLEPEKYVFDWWMTLFTRTLPHNIALRCWDLFLINENYLYRITLALIIQKFGLHHKSVSKTLLESFHSLEDILRVLEDMHPTRIYINQTLFFRILASDRLCGISMNKIKSIAKRVGKSVHLHNRNDDS